MKEIRDKLHLTQQQLADRLLLSRNYIAQLEMGVKEPSIRVASAVEGLLTEVDAANTPAVDQVIVGEGDTEELKEFSYRLKTMFMQHKVALHDVVSRLAVHPDRLDEWLHGRKFPRAAEGRRLADYLGVHFDWLMRGEGEPELGPSVREDALSALGVPLPREVGVVSWSHAGQAASYEEIPKEWRLKVVSNTRDRRAIGVIVEGDCMEPKYLAGDILVIEPSQSPRSGKPVVAKLRDDAVQVRIYTKMPGGRIRLASMKPEIYPTIEYAPEELHWIWPVHSMIRQE